MKIDYISDLHLEFQIENDVKGKELTEAINRFLGKIYNPMHVPGQILFLSGDISSNNNQIKALIEVLSVEYEYVFFVFGNHEMYLSGLFHNSFEKIYSLKESLSSINNCIFLDGDVFEYNGYKIGGACLWYDFSYGIHNFNLTKEEMYGEWKRCMLDASHISDGQFYDVAVKKDGEMKTVRFNPTDFFEKEYVKLLKLKECDIILTHIMPFIPEDYPSYYKIPTTGFFSFDGENFIKSSKVKHWFAGHTHEPVECIEKGIGLHINPFGYPNEKIGAVIKQIEI
jgi:UDP-2,3-diacylglucosamine pyrophosphatase LpxH